MNYNTAHCIQRAEGRLLVLTGTHTHTHTGRHSNRRATLLAHAKRYAHARPERLTGFANQCCTRSRGMCNLTGIKFEWYRCFFNSLLSFWVFLYFSSLVSFRIRHLRVTCLLRAFDVRLCGVTGARCHSPPAPPKPPIQKPIRSTLLYCFAADTLTVGETYRETSFLHLEAPHHFIVRAECSLPRNVSTAVFALGVRESCAKPWGRSAAARILGRRFPARFAPSN